ncbi:MAG: hypothetical protein N2038_14005 [Geminicoccaceae bacterium]|nr:hypothetical protein [Geminicoccaceae bacterium]MCS7269250.1 hypothetical protein [Geminicoccaceae bacterium]MCX7631347.1 hypothetical protein [Geminicoccaceae bacterium]MDW8125312.1 hypothetical protein [Geminicoccaceae bacterium]MDW8342445.1 hypothetical protein [Geminicoccaceae bacterium]
MVPKLAQPRRFLASTRGSVAVEYALVGSLVAVGCAAALFLFADAADGLWRFVAERLVPALAGPPPAP